MRRVMSAAAVTSLIIGLMSSHLQAAVQPGDTATWVGAANGGFWGDANSWQRASDNLIGDASAILGTGNGSDGANSSPTAGKNIVIGGGDAVGYNFMTSGGFKFRQGSNLIIKEGASWTQQIDATYDETPWTKMDGSNFILDGGSFRRLGSVPEATNPGDFGGGLLVIGSWDADNNFGQIPAPAVINIQIKNGGQIENEGDLWFGSMYDSPEDGLHVDMTINDGSLNLYGGDTFGDDQANGFFEALTDLAFTYRRKDDASYADINHQIDFHGPGSITVSKAGINVARENSSGVLEGVTPGASAPTDLVTYQQLWGYGILRANGVSGGYYDAASETVISTGRDFNSFFTVAGSSGSDGYKLTAKTPTTVTWDGGTGEWNDDAKWNGGQTAVATMGGSAVSGTMNRGPEGGQSVVLDGSKPGGANVTFDPNPGTGIGGDFRISQNNGFSDMTIKNGASFTFSSASDVDGKWARWSGNLTVDGAGSVYKRIKDGVNSFSGGATALGAYDGRMGQEVAINVTNGGKIEHDGEWWFGRDGGENPAGFSAIMTINNGTVDLKGGDAIEGGFGIGNGSNDFEVAMSSFLGVDFSPSLMFQYSDRAASNGSGPAGPAGEKYAINFTGPGSLTVDHAGIWKVYMDVGEVPNTTLTETMTYEELWEEGILQANGLSGLDGANFATYFSVINSLGQDGYKLTSLIGAGLAGDYNNNGTVDAADYVAWRNGDSPDDSQAGYDLWKANFGKTAGSGSSVLASSAAVPEPSAIMLLIAGVFGLVGCLRGRQR